jgi:hypothetical protein
MNIYRISMATLIAMAITPMALAQVYKCDGPNGPVYTDRECAPGAAEVEFQDTSGVSGVSDQTKAELAEKKAGRDLEKERNRSTSSTPVTNYQATMPSDEVNGRWLRGRNRPGNREPVVRPVQPIQKVPGRAAARRK